jgi:tripartite-type tricarboxylate transporter receptor subunit TctC
VLSITNAMIAVNPHLNKDPGFDALHDLVLISIVSRAPMFMVTGAASSIQSIKDLVQKARANPGKLTYGTSGEGSIQHFMGETFKRAAGIDLLAVPYKGAAPALQDLVNGQIDLCFGGGIEIAGFLQSGKLRVLAVTSAKRLTRFPEVPTVQEAGVADYAETVSVGYAVPRGTRAAIVAKLNEAIRAVVLKLEQDQEFSKVGSEVVANSPEEATALLRAEYERYGKLVKELGLKPQ